MKLEAWGEDGAGRGGRLRRAPVGGAPCRHRPGLVSPPPPHPPVVVGVDHRRVQDAVDVEQACGTGQMQAGRRGWRAGRDTSSDPPAAAPRAGRPAPVFLSSSYLTLLPRGISMTGGRRRSGCGWRAGMSHWGCQRRWSHPTSNRRRSLPDVRTRPPAFPRAPALIRSGGFSPASRSCQG